jgi:hypothetical protein
MIRAADQMRRASAALPVMRGDGAAEVAPGLGGAEPLDP